LSCPGCYAEYHAADPLSEFSDARHVRRARRGQQVEDEFADGGSLADFFGGDAFCDQQGSQAPVWLLPVVVGAVDVEPDSDAAFGDADVDELGDPGGVLDGGAGVAERDGRADAV
jgi:hypothetical protein